MKSLFFSALSISLTCSFFYTHPVGGASVGINYGLMGDNLPPPSAVVAKLQQIKVDNIRIFEPDNDVLTALHNSGISVIVGTRNEDLKPLASDSTAAEAWVAANILPHTSSLTISCVTAGNEVFPTELTPYITPAMHNLDSALIAANLSIPVSTAISMAVLSNTFPPSAAVFSDGNMTDIVQFLSSNEYPLLLNAYTYYPRVADPANVALDYALFESQKVIVQDGPNAYMNLFDAMLDSAYAALEKIGGADVDIIVGETGLPTSGSADASVENAEAYINNLIDHAATGNGTPRRPARYIQAYIFAMFNENQKPQGVEQHWGLHNPDFTPVYNVDHF